MLELGRFVGREQAHHIIYESSMKAFEQEKSLKECLLQTSLVMEHLTPEDIERLFDYGKYVGLAPELARAAAKDFRNRS